MKVIGFTKFFFLASFEFTYLILLILILFFIYLIVINNLPDSQLHSYSCLDNIKKVTLINSYHRLTLNYAQIAESLYSSSHPNHVISSKILEVVKRNHDDTSSTKITNF